jgi:hypothetical protein
MYKRISLLCLVLIGLVSMAKAQTINSPYSRYGLGDIVPSQNIVNRGMGGVSAAYYDYASVNFLNPASYARLQATSLDIGLELNSRTLRASDPPRKFNAYSPNISYVQLGFPLKKSGGWGMNIGLRPLTRINYKIERTGREPGIDSTNTLFEGFGGAYMANIGTGFTVAKNLTVGINAGYLFGSKDDSRRHSLVNDSVFYYKSNQEVKTNYGGLMLNAGIQYTAILNKTSLLRFGAYGNMQQSFNAKQDKFSETFEYNSNTGGTDTIDVIDKQTEVKGKVKYPASFGAGIIYDKLGKWMLGIDFTTQKWSDFTFYDQKDAVRDSWSMHIGGQVLPKGGKSYWANVVYRAGFSFGTDYISVDKDLPKWGLSLSAGLPMRKPSYTNQFSVINTTLEFGQRGTKTNVVRESYFNFCIGLSLSDIWFIKRKYD